MIKNLFSHILWQGSSEHNRTILVRKDFGFTSLFVDGVLQSGPYNTVAWNIFLRQIHFNHLLPIKKIAMVGVGGGVIIKLLHSLFPQANITAVDIDETIISLAKRYFGLHGSYLRFQTADAQDFLNQSIKQKKQFDCIVIDVFIGSSIPDFVASTLFLQKIKSLLSPGGIVLINYQRDVRFAAKGDIVLDKIQNIFQSVLDREIFRNRFFFARN